MALDTMDAFNSLYYETFGRVLGLLGMNVLQKGYKRSFHGWMCELSVWIAVFSTIFTLCTFDLEVKLNASTSIGVVAQGIAKIRSMLMFKTDIRENVFYLKSVYKANRNTPMSVHLIKWCRIMKILIKAIAVTIAITLAAYSLSPVAWFLKSGEWIPMLSLFVPGVNVNTVHGYLFYALLHFSWNLQTSFGYFASDCLLLTSAVHVWPLVDIFEDQFMQMDRALVAEPKVRETEDLHRAMNNLIKMHVDIRWYIERVKRIHNILIFTETNTNAMCMVLIIFCVMVQVWYPVYFLFVMMFVKLFAICVMGTVVELATDKLLNILVQSHWYLLPLELQHKFKLMLLSAQNPIILMTGTMPLNMITFVGYMKNIYSVGMILVEMID